jgi:hypothetical protein
MNGGAWLACDGAKVDVLLRDLDAVDAWSERAARGVYEVDALLGYVAGAPTYMLLAERAVGRTLRGSLPPVSGFPDPLRATGIERWTFGRRFSLDHARMRAARADLVGAVAQATKAVIEQAHAVLCGRREWVFNEKRIVERAGLSHLHDLFAAVPRGAAAMGRWVDAVTEALAAGERGAGAP